MGYDAARRKARREERRAEYEALDPTKVTKRCLGCDVEKPLVDFSISLGGKLGRYARCKACRPAFRKATTGYAESQERQNRQRRERYASDAEYRKSKLDANRDARYGLAPGEYDDMLAQQAGKCAICFVDEAGGHGGFHVDHDHKCCPGPVSCGKCIRGLLCHKCNTALGLFEDDTRFLSFAIQYLER